MAVHENAKVITAPKTFSVLPIGLLVLAQLACGLIARAPTPSTAIIPPTETATATSVPFVSPSPTSSPLPLTTPSPTLPPPTSTPFPTQTASPTETPTPTLTPTYAILRGEVIPAHVNCRYGPGPVYLYKYGLLGGSNLNLIGRTEVGDWILVQAIGGNNPCWMKAEFMDIQGDVFAVAPADPHVILPWSPYYTPLTNVSATRVGETVTVSWASLTLRAGDEADPVPYVVEAWVCRDGVVIFTPVGAFQPAVEIVDEPGCTLPSHGRVMAAEKHGYTWPVEIVWP